MISSTGPLPTGTQRALVRPRLERGGDPTDRVVAGTLPLNLVPRPLVEQSVRHMFDMGDSDGLYRTLYTMGPFPAAALSATLHFVGLQGEQFRQDDKASLATIIKQQNQDGSFSPYPGAPPSKDITSTVLLAMDMAQRSNPHIQRDAAFLDTLEGSRRSAEAYVRSDAPSVDSPMLRVIYQTLHDTCRPDEPRLSPPLGPTTQPGLVQWLKTGRIGSLIGAQMSLPATLLMPCVGILSYYIDKDRPAHRVEDRVLKTLHLDKKPEQALQQMERDIRGQQDKDGGWYIALATALNMAALKQRGMAVDDPVMQRGAAFIDTLKRGSERTFVGAELWDTAEAGQVFMQHGIPASHPKLQKMIDALLSQQVDGLWAFGSNSEHYGDKDSTGAVCQFLTEAYKTATPAQQPRIKAAVEQATEKLLDLQLADGGFNGWGKTAWRFGRRTPSPMEAAMFDASATDVTGRVLGVMLTESRAGILNPDLQKRVDHAADRMEGYLKGAQSSNGSWWSRWMAGYFCSPAFIAPPLRLRGMSPEDPCMVRLRDFLTKSQQPDGGFGETNEADISRKLAGQGPSTPVQTAMALVSLIASSPSDDIRDNRAIDKAVRYLESHAENGTWSNGKPLYTSLPGLDYYDAPFMTQLYTTLALSVYQDAVRHGVTHALQTVYGGAG